MLKKLNKKRHNFFNNLIYSIENFVLKQYTDFKQKVYLYFCFISVFFSPATILLNLNSWWPIGHMYSLIFFGVFNLVFYLLARFGNKFYPTTYSFVMLFAVFFIWIFNEGAEGGLNYYFIGVLSFQIFLLREKKRLITLTITSVLIVISFIIYAENTDFFTSLMRFPTVKDKIYDNLASIFFVYFSLALIQFILSKSHDSAEKDKNFYINEVEIRATTDFLTNLKNRNFINDKLADLADNTKRNEICFSIIMADIDKFKLVNDVHGHIIGDEVLKEFANTLNSYTRKTDICGRFGGEEFIIILPETPLKKAIEIAEKLRVEAEKLTFLVPDLKITSSFGVAEYHPSELLKSFISRTDSYLYRSKETGRNKVTGEKIS